MTSRLLYPLAALAVLSTTAAARAEIFDGFPDVLICGIAKGTGAEISGDVVFYVDGRLESGGVFYKTLGRPINIEVSPDGSIRGRNLKDCDGRTVDELRREGRAFDLR